MNVCIMHYVKCCKFRKFYIVRFRQLKFRRVQSALM